MRRSSLIGVLSLTFCTSASAELATNVAVEICQEAYEPLRLDIESKSYADLKAYKGKPSEDATTGMINRLEAGARSRGVEGDSNRLIDICSAWIAGYYAGTGRSTERLYGKPKK